MINSENMPKAYREVLEVLEHVSKENKEKIPNELIETFELAQEKNYNFQVTHIDDFENQEMLIETKYILAILFRDYWATEEQRKKILTKEAQDNAIEESQKPAYNRDDLFKDSALMKEEHKLNDENQKENLEMVVVKESIFQKILTIIRNLFKKNQ